MITLTLKSFAGFLLFIFSTSFSSHLMQNSDFNKLENEVRLENRKQSKKGFSFFTVIMLSTFFGTLAHHALNSLSNSEPAIIEEAPAMLETPVYGNLQGLLMSQENFEKPPRFSRKCVQTIKSSNYCYEEWDGVYPPKELEFKNKKLKKKKR